MSDWRIGVAERAYAFVCDDVRPFLERGGNLYTKGSAAYPSKLRAMLARLDKAVPVTHATRAALLLEAKERRIEHVIPFKRIVVEIVDPGQAHPRSNASPAALAGGPAASAEHLLEILDRLLVKCWVTPDEHTLLNRSGPSAQWDAQNGDGWGRYKAAGIEVVRL